MDLSKVSENEYVFLQFASRDRNAFPLLYFEHSLIDCFDPSTNTIDSISNAKKFLELLNCTKSVIIIHIFYALDWRTILFDRSNKSNPKSASF